MTTIWNYFNKCVTSDNSRRAQCNICKNIYSYETTTGNLKTHLKKMHGKNVEDIISGVRRRSEPDKTCWLHFTKEINDPFIATCNYCKNAYSYRSSLHNLAMHLSKKHPDVYEKYYQKLPNLDAVAEEVYVDCNDDELNDTATLVSQLFEKDSDTEDDDSVRCVICRINLDNDDEEMRRHLRDKHPNLVDRQKNEESEVLLKEDKNEDEEIYTQLVYFDDENTTRQMKQRKTSTLKYRKRRESNSSYEENLIKTDRRKYSNDSSPEERPNKLTKSDDEIDNFGNYITCLLRKMPQMASRRIQKNIINMILSSDFEGGIDQQNITPPQSFHVSSAPLQHSDSVTPIITPSTTPCVVPVTLQPVHGNYIMVSKESKDTVKNTTVSNT